MNLFNIGVEGQYLLGGFFAAAAGGVIVAPRIPARACSSSSSRWRSGALWAGFAGVLKVTEMSTK